MNKYKYYLLNRPLDIGTAPDDFIESSSFGIKQRVLKNGTEAWGTVTYDRKLTDEEIKKFELLEVISEEKKQEAIKDIQNLDRIYKDLVELQFNDKNINILMDKMSTLINKEIVKQISKSDITHKQYEEIVNKNILVSLDKEEAIRYYADKIVYDSITDCSENNRIFSVDEYANNDFIVKNFAEIVKRINLDERINDLEVNSDTKEIDMVFYLDYCPHCYQEDLDIDDDDRSRIVENFTSFIKCYYKDIIPDRWFRTNTRSLIRDFINKECENEDTELVYNILSKELYECGFIEKYLDGYTVNVNANNIDELLEDLQTIYNEINKNIEDGEIEDG